MVRQGTETRAQPAPFVPGRLQRRSRRGHPEGRGAAHDTILPERARTPGVPGGRVPRGRRADVGEAPTKLRAPPAQPPIPIGVRRQPRTRRGRRRSDGPFADTRRGGDAAVQIHRRRPTNAPGDDVVPHRCRQRRHRRGGDRRHAEARRGLHPPEQVRPERLVQAVDHAGAHRRDSVVRLPSTLQSGVHQDARREDGVRRVVAAAGGGARRRSESGRSEPARPGGVPPRPRRGSEPVRGLRGGFFTERSARRRARVAQHILRVERQVPQVPDAEGVRGVPRARRDGDARAIRSERVGRDVLRRSRADDKSRSRRTRRSRYRFRLGPPTHRESRVQVRPHRALVRHGDSHRVS